MTTQSNETNVKCPRCGYDQRGVIGSWNERCPLEGACAECGLVIQWVDLLSAKLQRPRWSVEYAQSFRDFVRRTVMSLGMVFLPWVMWRSLKMSHPPRVRKILAVGIVLVMLLIGLGYVAARINATADMYYRYAASTPNVSFLRVCLQSVFIPWSKTSPGSVTIVSRWSQTAGPPLPNAVLGTRTLPLPPPAQISIRNSNILRLWWWRTTSTKSGMAFGPLPAIILMLLCFPLGFLTLPRTRRKAKVRWIHVARIMLYSLGWLFVPMVLALASSAADFSRGGLGHSLFWITQALAHAGTPLFLVVFWQAAVGRYLRMPHSLGVAIGVGLMTWLFVHALLFYSTNPMSPSEFLEMAGKAIWGPRFHFN